MIFLKYFPFSLHWIVRRCIGSDIKTILDLGCGSGDFMKDISYGEKWSIIGVELDNDSIDQARRSKIYNRVIKGNITKLSKSITREKYDVVIATQAIEHLDKKRGLISLKKWEQLADKKVIISTSVGFIKFDRVEKKGPEINVLQKHLSGWYVHEFQSRGYEVHGQGIGFIYGEYGLIRKLPAIFWPFLILLSYLLAPLAFINPNMGTYMIAVKQVKRS